MGDKYNAEKVELGIRIELLCQISEENTARFYFTNYNKIKELCGMQKEGQKNYK